MTLLLALPGVLDSSLGTTLDILATADRLCLRAGRSAPFQPVVVGVQPLVESGTGQTLTMRATLDTLDPRSPRLVVVPGCNRAEPEEVESFLASPEVVQAGAWLARVYREGSAQIAGSCVATFVMAEHGLLDGQRATTTWWLAPLFRQRYPQVDLDESATVVHAGRLCTGGAAFSQVDVALGLVARMVGAEAARDCMRYLVLDRRPSQARYTVTDVLARTSPEVERAERWIRDHLSERITLPLLARATGTSPRTLARRIERTFGLTPMRLVARMRIEQAVHLLESTDWSFERVAEEVGMAAGVLRRGMVKERGQTAREIRARGG
jgi:transcriptional regulator GlxA family with amidase domain